MKMKRIEHIKSVAAQPCVKCPATGMVTFLCWNCELFIGGYKNGDVKCAYPLETPLTLSLFKLERDATRWSVKYHFRKSDLAYGHPALFEFSRIYECNLGRVWNTWIRDKSKLGAAKRLLHRSTNRQRIGWKSEETPGHPWGLFFYLQDP